MTRPAPPAAPLLVLAALLGLLAPSGLAAEPLRVHAVNAPLAHFAESLAGAAAEVTMPVPEGADPATWQPGIADVMGMQQADLILLNGAGLYGWVQRVSLPRARVVDTLGGLEGELIEIDGLTHSHGDEPEHTHAATAPDTWLDPRLAGLQAGAVAEALTRLLPGEAEAIAERLAELEAALAALDAAAAQAAAAVAGEPILAYHPGYEYLARRHGLDIAEVHWDRQAPPDAAAIAELDEALQAHPARLMLFAAPPGPEALAILDARGLTPVLFDTAASVAPAAVMPTLAAGLAALEAAGAAGATE